MRLFLLGLGAFFAAIVLIPAVYCLFLVVAGAIASVF